jgi:hypothetical protein
LVESGHASKADRGTLSIDDAQSFEDLMKFLTVIQLGGKTATGIPVPAEVVESLGQGKRPKVRVTIGGYTYRSTIAPYTGQYMLPLSAEHRQGAGVAAGDEIEVDVELDTEPREVEIPPDFAEALSADAEAKRAFEKLSYTHKREHVLAIEQAKKAETRQRRIEKAIQMLRGQ